MNRLGFQVKQCPYTEAWQILDKDGNVDREFDTKKEATEELRIYYS